MTLTFEYVLNEREKKALEELLPFWQQWKGKNGNYPFKNWGLEELFQAIMECGSRRFVSEQIKHDQWRKRLIDTDEWLNKERFRLKEEREGEETMKIRIRKIKITDMDMEQVMKLAEEGADLIAEDGNVYRIFGEEGE